MKITLKLTHCDTQSIYAIDHCYAWSVVAKDINCHINIATLLK